MPERSRHRFGCLHHARGCETSRINVARVDTLMARSDRPDGPCESSAAFVVYLAFSFLVVARGVPGRPGIAFIGEGTDPIIYMWYLRWWRYAFEHRLNPFLTDLLWAPLGFNLAWTTFIPIPAWLVMPIGHAL